jgi:hypothetical protein
LLEFVFPPGTYSTEYLASHPPGKVYFMGFRHAEGAAPRKPGNVVKLAAAVA